MYLIVADFTPAAPPEGLISVITALTVLEAVERVVGNLSKDTTVGAISPINSTSATRSQE